MTLFGEPLLGETPIDDVSGLKIPGITTRAEFADNPLTPKVASPSSK